jgi:G2/mitotic-specific cyclin 2
LKVTKPALKPPKQDRPLRSRTTEAVKKHVQEVEERPESAKKVCVPKKLVQHDDLDADDFEDPMMVSEYVHEIFDYLKEIEV